MKRLTHTHCPSPNKRGGVAPFGTAALPLFYSTASAAAAGVTATASEQGVGWPGAQLLLIAVLVLIVIAVWALGLSKRVQQQRQQLADLLGQQERLQAMVDGYTCSYKVDRNLEFTEVSAALCQATGFAEHQLLGRRYDYLFHSANPPELLKSMLDTVYFGSDWQGEILQRTASGTVLTMHTTVSPVMDDQGELEGYMATQIDVSPYSDNQYLTETDSLTRLWNQRRLKVQIDGEIARVERGAPAFSLLLMQLDNSRELALSCGHAVVDDVLRELADLAGQHCHPADILGRWAESQLLIIYPCTPYHSARAAAERLRAAVEFRHFSHLDHVSVSVGFAEYSAGERAADLVQRITQALEIAVQTGGNRVSGKPRLQAITPHSR